MNNSLLFPDYKELFQGCAAYIEEEKRDAMYKLARQLVNDANWNPEKLAEGIGVLLLTWNAAFYTKYGSFDFDKLENFIEQRMDDLKNYNKRTILSYEPNDDKIVGYIFTELLEVTKSVKKVGRTPVGTAKALHLFSPEFFSIWDNAIAKKFKVHWGQKTQVKSPECYIKLQHLTKRAVENVLRSYENETGVSREIAIQHLCKKWHPKIAMAIYDVKPPSSKSLVKMVDEYNYVKYSMNVDISKYRDVVLKVISHEEK